MGWVYLLEGVHDESNNDTPLMNQNRYIVHSRTCVYNKFVMVCQNDVMYLVRFGEHTLKKLVGWLENNKCVGKDFNVLDIGCGNGVTLVEMVRFNSTNLILDNSLTAKQFFLEFQSGPPLLLF